MTKELNNDIIFLNFITNPYDIYIYHDINKFTNYINSSSVQIIEKNEKFIAKNYLQYTVKFKVKEIQITEEKLVKNINILDKIYKLVNKISYYPLNISLTTNRLYFYNNENIVPSMKTIIIVFIEYYLGIKIKDISHFIFDSSNNIKNNLEKDDILINFIPMIEDNMIIYEKKSVIMNLMDKLDLNKFIEYNYSTLNPLGKYILNMLYKENKYFNNVEDDILMVEDIILIKINNLYYNESFIETFENMLVKYLADGYFTLNLNKYPITEVSVLKEIIKMWDMKIIKEYTDIIIIQTNLDFGGITPEAWIKNSLKNIMRGGLPSFTVSGIWSKKIIETDEDLAKLYYIIFRAYDLLIKNNNEQLLESYFDFKVDKKLNITTQFASLSQVHEFISNMNKLDSRYDSLVAEKTKDLKDFYLKKWCVQKNKYKIEPLGIRIDKQIFLVKSCEDIYTIDYDIMEIELLNELKLFFTDIKEISSDKLISKMPIIDILDLITYKSYKTDKEEYIFSDYVKNNKDNPDIQRIIKHRYLFFNNYQILGLQNIGPISGYYKDNIDDNYHIVPPPISLTIKELKEDFSNFAEFNEEVLVKNVLGKIFTADVFIMGENIYYPFFSISLPENYNANKFDKLIEKIWKCSILLSPWCKMMILKFNILSAKMVKDNYFLLNATDSIEDGKRALQELENMGIKDCFFIND